MNNNLTILMNDKKQNRFQINARDIWEKLGSKQKFVHWFSYQVAKYDLKADVDFVHLTKNIKREKGIREYALTKDASRLILEDSKGFENNLPNVRSLSEVLTVSEFSKITGIHKNTINEYVRRFYPEKVKHGVATLINEEMATRIKLSYQNSGRNDLANVREVQNINTDLEKTMIIQKAMEYLQESVQDLRSQNQQQGKRLEILSGSERKYTSTDLAKELGLVGPKTLNKILIDNKILYRDKKGDLQPYYTYSTQGYFVKKQTILENEKEVYHLYFTQKGREMVLNKLQKN